MNPDIAVERARLLIQQDRYAQAEELLRMALSQTPNLAEAHSLLGLCLAQNRDQLVAATQAAERGVHLAPDNPFSYYILSVIWGQRNQLDSALATIDQAIALVPNSATFHGHRSHLLARQNKWQASLDAAENGLSHDPENEECATIRVLALERLGRVTDAIGEADAAIRQAPNSSQAHASRGWALLQKGQYRPAQEAFREALRLEPSNEFARVGMMQALNSSNFFFRTFYAMMMWVSRLDSRVQWGLIIGMWVGMNMLQSLAKKMPAIAPWVLPISILYLLLVMMTWIMHPLFNTLLRFHPFGKHLLSRKEKWASNIIAGTLVFGLIVGVTLGFVHQEFQIALLPIMFGIYLTIPTSVAFNTTAQWAVIVSIVAASCFGLLYLLIVGLMGASIFILPMVQVFIYGILLYCFAGQALIKAEDRV